MIRVLKWLARQAIDNARALLGGDDHRYLRSCRGVIHVGANLGQERRIYSDYNLSVIWIEPIPEVYYRLVRNLAQYPDQRAIKALITDRDGETRTLHVATNDGASSSIFDLHQHRDIWPEVSFVRDLRMSSMTLSTALRSSGIDRSGYDTLVMDTQGAELLVLKGATDVLPALKYIKLEAADFEAYKSSTTLAELTDYLSPHGFELVRRRKFAERPAGGAYYNVLFERTVSRA